MRARFLSLCLALLILVVSGSVASAQKPTPGSVPPDKTGNTAPGQVAKTLGAPRDQGRESEKDKQRHGIFGTIASKTSDGFTVTAKQGAVTVTITTNTKFHIPRTKNASLADVAVGDRVSVNGTPNAGGFVAKQVMVTPGKPTTQHRVGEVTAYSAHASITIKTIKGDTETFALTKDTTIKNPKGSGVNITDMVTVVSRRDPSSDTATASGIVVHLK